MTIDKIKYALEDRTLSVVAAKTGLSRNTLSNIMRGVGKPNAATIKVLADYLGVKDDA